MKITNEQIIKEWSNVPARILMQFGDKGDFARQEILIPHVFSLLGNIKNKTILDAGGAGGYLSRMMARKGAKVSLLEPAETLMVYAKQKEKEEKLGITFIQKDLSKFRSSQKFDIVLANMVLMDIPDYEEAMQSCIAALKTGGIFIMSITHPCFEMSGKEWRENGAVITKEYFEEYAKKQMIGYSFHRTLSTYLNLLIQSGCRIEEVVEPQLPAKKVGDHKEYAKDVHVPSFIFIKARKV